MCVGAVCAGSGGAADADGGGSGGIFWFCAGTDAGSANQMATHANRFFMSILPNVSIVRRKAREKKRNNSKESVRLERRRRAGRNVAWHREENAQDGRATLYPVQNRHHCNVRTLSDQGSGRRSAQWAIVRTVKTRGQIGTQMELRREKHDPEEQCQEPSLSDGHVFN